MFLCKLYRLSSICYLLSPHLPHLGSKAQILANRELFIQSGSDINLTCIAPQAPGPYTQILWFKDSELINDSARGGIRVVSEQQIKTSNLVISKVLHADSGNYTCAADNSSRSPKGHFWPQNNRSTFHLFYFHFIVFLFLYVNICVCVHIFYLCLDSDNVFVHIINSEKHAAMQHELASYCHVPSVMQLCWTLLYSSLLQRHYSHALVTG